MLPPACRASLSLAACQAMNGGSLRSLERISCCFPLFLREQFAIAPNHSAPGDVPDGVAHQFADLPTHSRQVLGIRRCRDEPRPALLVEHVLRNRALDLATRCCPALRLGD